MCATRIRFGLMINAGIRLALRRRLIFGGPVIARVNWEEFVGCQVRANKIYSETKCQFSIRNRDVLMNAQSPHMWWFTLKSAVFVLSSSLPLVLGGGGQVCESVGKADLLAYHFDGK